jgi:hypothetical protein
VHRAPRCSNRRARFHARPESTLPSATITPDVRFGRFRLHLTSRPRIKGDDEAVGRRVEDHVFVDRDRLGPVVLWAA